MNQELSMRQGAPQQPKASALAVMASRLNCDPAKLHSTLKNTVFKGANDDELLALCIVANEYKLNPLTKEIYAFPGKGGGITPIVSIDGWLNLCNSHPQMDGVDFEFAEDGEGRLVSCTCVIYRKDRSRPIRVTEYLAECKRGTEPWKMERRMLRHKALIQCARVAFGFSGITDEDEAEVMVERGMREVEARVVEEEARERLAVGGAFAQMEAREQGRDGSEEADEVPFLEGGGGVAPDWVDGTGWGGGKAAAAAVPAAGPMETGIF